jgi:hypothetical protein
MQGAYDGRIVAMFDGNYAYLPNKIWQKIDIAKYYLTQRQFPGIFFA